MTRFYNLIADVMCYFLAQFMYLSFLSVNEQSVKFPRNTKTLLYFVHNTITHTFMQSVSDNLHSISDYHKTLRIGHIFDAKEVVVLGDLQRSTAHAVSHEI